MQGPSQCCNSAVWWPSRCHKITKTERKAFTLDDESIDAGSKDGTLHRQRREKKGSNKRQLRHFQLSLEPQAQRSTSKCSRPMHARLQYPRSMPNGRPPSCVSGQSSGGGVVDALWPRLSRAAAFVGWLLRCTVPTFYGPTGCSPGAFEPCQTSQRADPSERLTQGLRYCCDFSPRR